MVRSRWTLRGAHTKPCLENRPQDGNREEIAKTGPETNLPDGFNEK